MKRLILFALLGGLSLATTAQAKEETQVRIRGYQIELPVRPYVMLPGDIDEYTGVYDLSNGEAITLSRRGRQMFARIGNGEPKKLVAAQSNVFVALDRKLKMTINSDLTGEVLMPVSGRSPRASTGEVARLISSR